MRNVFFYKVCVGQNAFFRVQLTAFALSQNGSMKTKLFRFAAITAAARYIHVPFEMLKLLVSPKYISPLASYLQALPSEKGGLGLEPRSS